MANRRRSGSRRTPASPAPGGAGETAQSAVPSAPKASSARAAPTEPSPTGGRAPAEATTAQQSGNAPRQAAGIREAIASHAPITVSAETRRAMIANAAYLRAERRGFAPGHEEEDWLAAEKEVDALLSGGQGGPQ